MATERTEKTVYVEGGTLSGVVVMALVLFAMVNYLAHRHYARWDWTSSQLYTLSEKSEKVLATLDRQVEAAIFMAPGSQLYPAADELLSRYEAANPAFFKKRVIDPAKNLLEAQRLVEKHNIERNNVIVIASGDDRRVIDEQDLAEYDYSGAQMGQPPVLKEFKGEQEITSAILELIEAKKPKILLTTGHGESTQALSKAKILLGKDNFEFEDWNSLQSSEFPADVDLVMVAGPTTRFFEGELDLFTSYIDGGGRLLFLLDPLAPGTSGLMSDPALAAWLARYGVDIGDNVVIDPNVQMAFFGPETLFTATYGFHPIVRNLDQGQRPVHLTLARSVGRADAAPADYEITELVKTSEEAWGETDIEDVDNIGPNEGEVQGSVGVAVAVSFKVGGGEDAAAEDEAAADKAGEDEAGEDETAAIEDSDSKAPEARLVVFGDIDFAADTQIESAGNSELLINTFNWLVEREQLIAIEGRKPEETTLSLTSSELTNMYLLVMLFMPGLSVFMGVWIYLRRRR